MADFHYFNLDDHSERDQPLIFSCNLQGLRRFNQIEARAERRA